jgi:hypothetical protein
VIEQADGAGHHQQHEHDQCEIHCLSLDYGF